MAVRFKQSKYWAYWLVFQTILNSLNRRAELQRLISWARRKHLAGPIRGYTYRLSDEESRLAHYTLISPLIARLACVFYALACLFRRTRRFYPRGSAAKYKIRNV